ncbi:tryptophan 2,3-dioxygenase family protein, partial [Streptococcus suis]
RLLARRGLPVPAGRLERDFSIRYDAEEELLPVLQAVYEAPEKHWLEYEMSEKLVDLDQMFQLWRFRHMQTVERMIGYKPGTGQTRGADYLRER